MVAQSKDGAFSSCTLYLLWRTPPQKDAVSIWARAFGNLKPSSFPFVFSNQRIQSHTHAKKRIQQTAYKIELRLAF